MQKWSIGLFIFVLCLIQPVKSDSWGRKIGVGAHLESFKFIGDSDVKAAVSGGGGLSLRYGLSAYALITGDLSYGYFALADSNGWFREGGTPERTFIFPMTISLRLTPFPRSRLKPYLDVGGGLMLWDYRYLGSSTGHFWKYQTFRWGTRQSGAIKKSPTLFQGIGVECALSPSWALDARVGISWLLNLKNANSAQNAFLDQMVETRIGIVYYVLALRDLDGDGIRDHRDGDPLQPEDRDGFQDEDGIPDLDNDQDGIPDGLDMAPNEPEDYDGFEDYDGIPDPDNDQDGLADILDACPDLAEDVDGFEDEDGCPDLDNDLDGIPDVLDQCPDNPEKINGIADDDGCPDEKLEVEFDIFSEEKAALILEGVQFESGSAMITDDSFDILDRVILSLEAYPDVRLEIRGHTDSQGSAKHNEDLSLNRAEAVRQYFASQGIVESRMRAIGHGESGPIATNETPAGRAQNRRIEIVRIDQVF